MGAAIERLAKQAMKIAEEKIRLRLCVSIAVPLSGAPVRSPTPDAMKWSKRATKVAYRFRFVTRFPSVK
jgi:hypothetical protein